MKHWSLVLLLSLVCMPLAAQQMSLVEFCRLRRPLFNPSAMDIDKGSAILDLYTDETGFTFLADGNQPVKADEGDGLVTLTLPHNTAHITVRHDDFGQLMWRVPDGKRLKKRNHYRAVLLAGDPSRIYKSPKQWVIFRLNPDNVLLQIDSTTRPVRRKTAEYYMPLGEHSFRAEAPFYEAQEGTFTLTDVSREVVEVNLQPFYSFLTVKRSRQDGDLYIDNRLISSREATSYRLPEGLHRVSVFKREKCWYDSLVFVGRSEKKLLELKDEDFYLRPVKNGEPFYAKALQDSPAATDAPVKLTAADSGAVILLDREFVGTGSWEGRLATGFHMAQTVKDGQESSPTMIWVEDEYPQEITLLASGTVYGLLNIHSNVAGARISVSGSDFGETPRMVQLDASYSYMVSLSKEGYRTATQIVRPRGNHMVDVYLELKKK